MGTDEKIRRMMADIFNTDMAGLGTEITPQTVPVWDSLAHIKLMLALEKEFRIRIPDETIVTLASFLEIVRIVEQLSAAA